jgi:hypothetical protein
VIGASDSSSVDAEEDRERTMATATCARFIDLQTATNSGCSRTTSSRVAITIRGNRVRLAAVLLAVSLLPYAFALLPVTLLAACVPPSASSDSTSAPSATTKSVAPPRAPSSGVAAASSSSNVPPAATNALTPLLETQYPIGKACSAPDAIARENRTLAARANWQEVVAPQEHLRVHVPAGTFQSSENADGFHLVSSLSARMLGEGDDERRFAIHIRRVSQSIDDVLTDTGKDAPIASIFLDDAFPKKSSASFVSHPAEPMRAGASIKASIAGKPGYVWVNGVEGYNSDYALIALGARDTLLIVADWNSASMVGQPECWQRVVLANVIESIRTA